MSKKKEERQLQIRQILEGKEKIKVAELAKLLSVTPETLRKDLDELQERKILIREHGYAKIQSSSVETFVELKAQKNSASQPALVSGIAYGFSECVGVQGDWTCIFICSV